MATTAREALPRGLLLLLGAGAAVVVLAGVRAVNDLVAPAFLALVLTLLVHPVRQWLQDRKWPTWAATVACILAVYGILLGLAAALVIATARFATLLPTYQDKLNDLIDDAVRQLNELGVGNDQIQAFLDSLDFSQLSGVITGVLGGLAGVVSNLVFILTLVLFMTFDAGSFPANLAATARDRPGIASAFQLFASGTRTYLLVSTVFGLIVAVLDTIALALMGIPVPVLWGLLAFITNYIPNIGFVIGLIPPAVLALLEGGPGLMIAVIVVYCVINLILQSVIQPKFVGDAVGLSTSITFLSLVFWTFVMGPLGALLAIPLSLLVKAILVDVDPGNAWMEPLLSNRPAKAVTASDTEEPEEPEQDSPGVPDRAPAS
ncbi:MAG: AI-2E family transporter [Nocardioidaceae bacterium]|nr:AI-2E family transporter [Nocardioidaceae bacterium]